MTMLYSHQDRLADLAGRSGVASRSWQSLAERFRRAASRTGAAFAIIHRAILTAKLRRLRYQLMFRGGCREEGFPIEDKLGHDPEHHAARLSLQPMILDDKWDF